MWQDFVTNSRDYPRAIVAVVAGKSILIHRLNRNRLVVVVVAVAGQHELRPAAVLRRYLYWVPIELKEVSAVAVECLERHVLGEIRVVDVSDDWIVTGFVDS